MMTDYSSSASIVPGKIWPSGLPTTIDLLIRLQRGELVRQLADAADHAHRQGLIHRDIKPANVLLVSAVADDDRPTDLSSMTPRLTDFGLARDLTSKSSTRTGVLVGTAEYMSPEQATGDVKARERQPIFFSRRDCCINC